MTDSDGTVRTVAVAIGPEHGTVSPDMVKDAAREALKGAGFDLLVYCGFAYEAYTSETAKEFAPYGDGFATAEQERQMGKLRVLLARMNPDLAMSEELLKKTGTGNLFMVFGEPDITIKSTGDEYTVEVHGVDVYDPTTVRSGRLRRMTSLVGSSTPTTTAISSSFVTPTSRALTSHTRSFSGR